MGAPDMRSATIIRYALTKKQHDELQAKLGRPVSLGPIRHRQLSLQGFREDAF